MINKINKIILLVAILLFCQQCSEKKDSVYVDENSITIIIGDVDFKIEKKGFRYSFQKKDGNLLAPAHPSQAYK
jgi:hypothetical protein